MTQYFFKTDSCIFHISASIKTSVPCTTNTLTLCEKYGISLLLYKNNHWEIINCWYTSKNTLSLNINLKNYLSAEEQNDTDHLCQIFCPKFATIELEITPPSGYRFEKLDLFPWLSTDIFSTKNIVHGIIDWNQTYSFNKYNNITAEEYSSFSENQKKEFTSLKCNSSGCYLDFCTDSSFIQLSGSLLRDREYIKIPFSSSHGFDVYEYELNNRSFLYRNCFTPKIGERYFSFGFYHNPKYNVRIYLPLYNEITELKILTYNEICPVMHQTKKLVFYGNSITQGASASRPGLSFVNILSRELEFEIYNYSISSCCLAFPSVAHTISTINADCIILDYSRNATSDEELYNRLTNFYSVIRKKNPKTPVVFMTTACFNSEAIYNNFDRIITSFYTSAKNRSENVFLINQKDIFEAYEYVYCCNDGEHYTDFGMEKVAACIKHLLNSIDFNNSPSF